jgi:hypothetical protein
VESQAVTLYVRICLLDLRENLGRKMTKQDFNEMVLMYKDQITLLKGTIENLRADKDKLSEQVFKLQDGIMAVRAPEVYRDYREDMMPVSEISEEEKKKMTLTHNLTKAYFTSIEQPLFKGAKDMEELLAPVIFSEVNKTESLHENSES